jgi:hypothetical protein
MTAFQINIGIWNFLNTKQFQFFCSLFHDAVSTQTIYPRMLGLKTTINFKVFGET